MEIVYDRSAAKDARLARMRMYATGLLVAAGVAYVLSTAFARAHPALAYVAAFAEAAMIGALADWFAVVALFRHPLGLRFVPHTAIIPRNKQRIAAQLSMFIQQNFLSAPAIVARIAQAQPAARLREWLLREENAAMLAGFATRTMAFVLSAFDDERARRLLHGVLTAQLRAIDFAALGGRVLDVLTENGRHQALLEEALALIEETLRRPETVEQIARAVLAESKLVEAMKRLGWNVDETIAERIVRGAARLAGEVRGDRAHALRGRFDTFVAGWIARLKDDAATRDKVARMRDELLASPALGDTVAHLWDRLRDWLAADLSDPASRVHATLAGMIGETARRMQADPDIERWVDEQILKAVPPLVEAHRGRIGRFIEEQIEGWHEDKFIAEMEREIGPDLQFIRMNGTIVGGLAGLAIHAVTQALA
ncbi:MAG TPA: DUF445 domain-containing protein [Burkholderiales bacterium]|nr:DUF445 domain-containing protein [Burkholderiales bacterium]